MLSGLALVFDVILALLGCGCILAVLFLIAAIRYRRSEEAAEPHREEVQRKRANLVLIVNPNFDHRSAA